MQELKIGVACSEEETQSVMKVYSKEDYSVVNRFESKSVILILEKGLLYLKPQISTLATMPCTM